MDLGLSCPFSDDFTAYMKMKTAIAKTTTAHFYYTVLILICSMFLINMEFASHRSRIINISAILKTYIAN